jgi:hypothetical protein
MASRVDARKLAVVRSADGKLSLHARVAFTPGELVTAFRVTAYVPGPTRHSVQLGVSMHALLEPELLRLTNHSCDPNVVLDTRALQVRAVRRIEPGAEVTCFYPSTEWSMAEPFSCCCEAPECLLTIAGAAYLPAEVMERYELADHIWVLLEQRGRIASP